MTYRDDVSELAYRHDVSGPSGSSATIGPMGTQHASETTDDRSHEVATTDAVAEEAQILDDVLVEEISIDGMCGVY